MRLRPNALTFTMASPLEAVGLGAESLMKRASAWPVPFLMSGRL
jgi:fumarylacetoacetate (FAA) hydrolase family protein